MKENLFKMSEISIICCYNNEKQYNDFCFSLEKQNMDYELLGINNIKKDYFSWSEAINSVIDKVRTKFVVFSHQDILFMNENQLNEFFQYLKNIDKNDILGVAGAKVGINHTITSIVHGENGDRVNNYNLNDIFECDTADECFFGGYIDFFKTNKFDEKICNNRHLYAVERCLYTKLLGNHVYVCSIPIKHNSKGVINNKYNTGFYKLCKKYNYRFNYISTTCVSGKTDFKNRIFRLIKANFYYYYKKLKTKVVRNNFKY